jgi:hypothetical protein
MIAEPPAIRSMARPVRLLGHSLVTTLAVASLQREAAYYEPHYGLTPWKRHWHCFQSLLHRVKLEAVSEERCQPVRQAQFALDGQTAMSRYLRSQALWPSDKFAVHVWHMVSAMEDAADLVEASRRIDHPERKAALLKKALVELKSFDDLVSEFQATLRAQSGAQLPKTIRAHLQQALTAYHRSVEPSRRVLGDIRNTLGAHRRGLPRDTERKRFAKDFEAWGEWEQHLVDLEKQCTLERWIGVINSAIGLLNAITAQSPGSWFAVHGDGLRLYFPLEPDDIDGTGAGV